jgi:[ribosomal protein S5]-alanine N-acetyltransferase
MRLETARLILRPPTLTDVPTIHELASHPDVAATTLNIPHPYPEGAAIEFVENVRAAHEEKRSYTLAMIRKFDDLLMGMITIRPRLELRHAEIGYWLGTPYWGQGYTTEAARRIIDFGFQELNLYRIYASYFTSNPASRRVMEKAGMAYEGTLRQHVCRFDVFHDLGYCGILREEWEAQCQER